MSKRLPSFNFIVCVDSLYGIGRKRKIPWKNADDMKHFKEVTDGHVVIMGRKTWKSLPLAHRPLKNRVNIVLTREAPPINYDNYEGALVVRSVEEVIKRCKIFFNRKAFVIGGSEIFELFMREAGVSLVPSTVILKQPILRIDEIYMTKLLGDYECDVRFPIDLFEGLNKELVTIKLITDGEIHIFKTVPQIEEHVEEIGGVCAPIPVVEINYEEKTYLDILKAIMTRGTSKGDRTGTGTLSLIGQQLRFNLSYNKLPLLTTKKMFPRGIIEELLFFIRGNTDNRILQEKDIHIWDGNTSREYLDKIGLSHYPEGTLGAAYGHQWRHWGATYESRETDYSGKGIDQLAEVVRMLREEPESRRIIISAWNVSQLKEMALPPCHMMYQFLVVKNTLNCVMTQRSGDMFLGVPFNIASVALLTILLAKVVGMTPGEVVINIADAHIYQNHIDQTLKQIVREPFSFPTISFKKDPVSLLDIEQMQFDDFIIEGYQSHPALKAPMAV